MPTTPDTKERKTPSKSKKKDAPHTRVKSGGRVSRRLKLLADLYIKGHPGQDVRFVYSPENKPDLSNVTSRHIDGYRLVHVKDLGDDIAEMLPGLKPNDPVRVGDVVMMSIASEIRQGIQAELDQAALDEHARVEEEFHDAVEQMELDKGMREEYKARPRGRSITELVERDVPVPDAHKE